MPLQLGFQAADGILCQFGQIDLLDLFQRLAFFHRSQFQHPIHQFLNALRLVPDVSHETLPLLQWHVLVQQFCRSPDGGQRALQFMGQGLHITLSVILARQCLPHRFDCCTGCANFIAAQVWQLNPFAGLHGTGIVAESFQWPADPDIQSQPQHQYTQAGYQCCADQILFDNGQKTLGVIGRFANTEHPL